jgi:hypothetical protein
MNTEDTKCYTINVFKKPNSVTEQEWFELDLNDPLMAVC